MTERNGRSSRPFRVGFWVLAALCAVLYILLAGGRYYGRMRRIPLPCCGTATAAYTHYYALVSAGIVLGLLGIACLAKKDWRRMGCTAAAAAAALVLYIPWLRTLFRQLAERLQNGYWIAPVTFSDLMLYGEMVFGVNGITVLLVLLLDKDAPVPERYAARYDVGFVQTLLLGGEPADAYLLTARTDSE